jgi:iron complex transport system substrate-binding protein
MEHVRMHRRRLLIAALLSPAAPLHATSPRAPESSPRVVSVGGALTEIVYALGAGSLLVGTDTTSVFPEAARTTPKVGYARALSAEGLLSLRPTLVLAGAEAGPPVVIEQVRAAGVRVVRAEAGHGIDVLAANVRRVAAALGRDAEGERLAAEVRARFDDVQRRLVRSGAAPRVLFVLSHAANNVQVAGRETAADALMTAAGAANAMRGFNGYRPLTAEAVVAAAPQAIVATTQGVEALGGTARLLAQPGLALTPAGRDGRVFARDALWLLGGGPRWPDAVAELARFLGTLA